MKFLAILITALTLSVTSFKNVKAQTYGSPILRDMVFYVSTGALIGVVAGLGVAATNPLSKDLDIKKNLLIGSSVGSLAGALLASYYLIKDLSTADFAQTTDEYDFEYSQKKLKPHLDNKLKGDLVHPLTAKSFYKASQKKDKKLTYQILNFSYRY